MGARELSLQEKIAIDILVRMWKKVDKKPSRNRRWYPCYVQMGTTLDKLAKCIKSLPKKKTPARMKKYLLTDTLKERLHMNAQTFYYRFDEHPSEYLEDFVSEEPDLLFYMQV